MKKHRTLEMMKTFGSMSHRSSDSVSSETVDETWSPEPSSGYCSAEDDHFSYSLRTPTGTGSRSDRRISESSSGISSKSLLSLSLSEALALTFDESPPPSPPPDDVLPDQASMGSRSPVSSVDYESSFTSAVPSPPSEFPRTISSRPDIYSLLKRVEPFSNRSSNFEKQSRGVETRTVTKEADQRRASQHIQTDLPSIEPNSVHDLSNDSRSHLESRQQHTSCCEENNDLPVAAGSQTTDWSNSRSCSVHMCEDAIIDEVIRKEGCELPEALPSSVFEETVVDDDTVYLVTADGSLKKLLPISEPKLNSSIKEKTVSTPSHRPLAVPRIEPRKSFDASFPEHSTGLVDEADSLRCNPDVCSPKLGVTGCHESPHITVDTDSTGSAAPKGSTVIGSATIGSATIGSATPIGSTIHIGSTTSTVPEVSASYKDSVDLRTFRVNVGFFHSYAAVEKTSDSCHSTAPSNPQSQDLSFIGHGVDKEDLSYDSMGKNSLLEAETTLPAQSQDLHDGCVTVWSTAAANEVLQETIEDSEVCDESSRSGNGSSSVDSSSVPKLASKRSRSSYRQKSKRRRRHSSPALAELEDHGYSLKVTCRPASILRSSASPCATIGEEMTSTDDASSVLAKLLLTREQLFPNEGSDGFIARRHCPGSEEKSAKSVGPGGQESSGSLLERLLTGEMDRDEIQRSEERIIRDRVQVRIDDDVVDEDVDLQLQDFDPGSLELENLEELWKDYGDLLGKFLS